MAALEALPSWCSGSTLIECERAHDGARRDEGDKLQEKDLQFAYFALFDQDLVMKLWPPERIAMGMLVCSVLRRELKLAPLVVLNVRRVLSPADWSSMARHLKLFQGNIHVRASRRKGGSALLKGIILAVDSGWKGPSLLHVTHTDVGDEDCARLAVYLRECPFLHTLRLSDNSITGDGAFALSSALRNCRQLSSLGTTFSPACNQARLAKYRNRQI
jgi:hypothetical protein